MHESAELTKWSLMLIHYSEIMADNMPDWVGLQIKESFSTRSSVVNLTFIYIFENDSYIIFFKGNIPEIFYPSFKSIKFL